MVAIVILNIAFSAFVIFGSLALLAWGIVSDRALVSALHAHSRRRAHVRRVKTPRPAGIPSRASQLTA
jgi:hypothetical protein